ncbi:MAG: 2-hydroxyacid dehydrogenase [Thermoplasmata archaeon]
MKIRAVLPAFLPVDEIRRRLLQLMPDLDIVSEPTASGRYPVGEIEAIVLTTFNDLTADVIGKMSALRFVQVSSTGYDRVDVAACRARGIMVSNIPVANSKTVAEHVVMLALASLRDLIPVDRELRNGRWTMMMGAQELGGKIFGIVGAGRIGRELATRLVPFEVSAIYSDKVPLPEEQERALGLTRVSLEELIAQSDIVSLHLPLSEETRGILGEAQLAKMKSGALLINTARAELVDTAALARAVGEGRIRAALDVYPTEPPDFKDPIFRAEHTVFTPHMAGVTQEAQMRFLQETVKNVMRFAQGKEPQFRVDTPGA